MSETRKETAEMRAWTCLDCGMEGEATDIPTAQEHHTSIHGCRGLCGWMPSSPQRAAARREPTYFVHVTLTVGIPCYGERQSIGDETEDVIAALRQQKPLPEGAHLYGSIESRVRTAKQLATLRQRAEKRRAERGY